MKPVFPTYLSPTYLMPAKPLSQSLMPFREGVCVWTELENSDWETGCGYLVGRWIEAPRKTEMKYCWYCGKAVEWDDYEDKPSAR